MRLKKYLKVTDTVNKLKAIVQKINTNDVLNIVEFSFDEYKLCMMSLQLQKIKISSKVLLHVKPTAVGVGKNFTGQISYTNQLKGEVYDIKIGELLCYLHVKVNEVILQSIITKNSAIRMDLKKSDEVICFIKASDLSICEILDD